MTQPLCQSFYLLSERFYFMRVHKVAHNNDVVRQQR